MEVYCNVTAGIPDPTVMWTKIMTGEHIKGNPLNIANISRAQAGEYMCTANNTCGVDSTVVDIDVQCKNVARSFLRRKYFKKGFKKGQMLISPQSLLMLLLLHYNFQSGSHISPSLFS